MKPIETEIHAGVKSDEEQQEKDFFHPAPMIIRRVNEPAMPFYTSPRKRYNRNKYRKP
jgi:hypothetical protein